MRLPPPFSKSGNPACLPAKKACRSGFSLIELLVVMAIIGVLAILAVTAASSVRERMQSAGCISNLRQITIAVDLYRNENNNSMPKGWAAGQTWVTHLMPYTLQKTQLHSASESIFISPLASLPVQIAALGTQYATTYSMNGGLAGTETTSAVRKELVKRPAHTILITNGAQNNSYGQSTATFWEPWTIYDVSNYDGDLTAPVPAGPSTNLDSMWGHIRYPANQNTATNALMVDGSVRQFKLGEVQQGHVIWYR